MADLTELQSSSTVKIVGSDSTGLEQTPVGSNPLGYLYVDGSNVTQPVSGTISFIPLDSTRLTYSAASTTIIPASSATDIFTITGSATKTIRVLNIRISGTRTTSSYANIILLKRSTANTGGTSSTLLATPHDSNNSAGTATVRYYTVNPTLGTLVGTIRSDSLLLPVVTPTNAQSVGGQCLLEWDFGNRPGQAIVLRGITQVLSINLGTITLAGANFDISIEWTEE